MAGLLVQILLSWLIVHLVEGKNLSVIGYRPSANRLTWFVVTFVITASFCASGFLIKMFPGGQQWIVNPAFSRELLVEGVWWNLKSVLFEELIFRGVLLYILIVRLGAKTAILLSSAAFGIYHWFSLGVIGNLIPMSVVFCVTGTMGLLLAYSYQRTGSVYVAVAIHLGWNLTQNFVFSSGPAGNGIFVPENGLDFRTDSYLIFAAALLVPMLGALSANYVYIKRTTNSAQGITLSARSS